MVPKALIYGAGLYFQLMPSILSLGSQYKTVQWYPRLLPNNCYYWFDCNDKSAHCIWCLTPCHKNLSAGRCDSDCVQLLLCQVRLVRFNASGSHILTGVVNNDDQLSGGEEDEENYPGWLNQFNISVFTGNWYAQCNLLWFRIGSTNRRIQRTILKIVWIQLLKLRVSRDRCKMLDFTTK